jgi:hypothetical protein
LGTTQAHNFITTMILMNAGYFNRYNFERPDLGRWLFWAASDFTIFSSNFLCNSLKS